MVSPRDILNEARPFLVRTGLDFLRGVISPARVGQPELLERDGRAAAATDDHGGCPYCAARVHIWQALGECLLAEKAQDQELVQMFAGNTVRELELAFRAMDTLEVIGSPSGAKLLARIVHASADTSTDYNGRARELFDMHDECERLAGIRNGQG